MLSKKSPDISLQTSDRGKENLYKCAKESSILRIFGQKLFVDLVFPSTFFFFKCHTHFLMDFSICFKSIDRENVFFFWKKKLYSSSSNVQQNFWKPTINWIMIQKGQHGILFWMLCKEMYSQGPFFSTMTNWILSVFLICIAFHHVPRVSSLFDNWVFAFHRTTVAAAAETWNCWLQLTTRHHYIEYTLGTVKAILTLEIPPVIIKKACSGVLVSHASGTPWWEWIITRAEKIQSRVWSWDFKKNPFLLSAVKVHVEEKTRLIQLRN